MIAQPDLINLVIRLTELLKAHKGGPEGGVFLPAQVVRQLRDALAAPEPRDEPQVARPLHEWHEDFGDVLWWSFVYREPPWAGSPLGSDWPGYHTHWTLLPRPYPITGSRAFDPSSPNQDD